MRLLLRVVSQGHVLFRMSNLAGIRATMPFIH
jgi:hypothetical protein